MVSKFCTDVRAEAGLAAFTRGQYGGNLRLICGTPRPVRNIGRPTLRSDSPHSWSR